MLCYNAIPFKHHAHFLLKHLHVCTIQLTKATAAQNEIALSYRSVRGLYFMAAVFVSTISY